MDSKLTLSQQCILMTNKVNIFLGYVRTSVASRLRGICLSSLLSLDEATCGARCPMIDSPIQEIYGKMWSEFSKGPQR